MVICGMSIVLPSLPTIADELALTAVEFIEETPIARIWKVFRPNGELAALKIYHHSDMRNDKFGFEYLKALEGHAAAKVYYSDTKVALTEWLDGPALGDLTRAGRDEEASIKLVEVANRLHAAPIKVSNRFPDLYSLFDPLRKLQFVSNVPSGKIQLLDQAKKLSQELLQTQKRLMCASW